MAALASALPELLAAGMCSSMAAGALCVGVGLLVLLALGYLLLRATARAVAEDLGR